MKSFVVLIIALAVASVAAAHAHLEASTPANHSTLSVAPSEVRLRFLEEVRLTALLIQSGDAKPQKLGPLPAGNARTFSLPLPPIGSGSYAITWRALSADGHVMSGTIAFTVQSAASPEAK